MLSQALATHERHSNTPFLLSTESFDTHVHVFDPKLGPYAAGRAYTPEDAPLQKLLALNQSLARDYNNTTLVLVQPSPYKNDCTVMMHCLRDLRDRGIRSFGIAVLDLDTITDAQLNEMHALGVRGIRLNFQADGKDVDITHLISLLNRTADRIRYFPSWAIQLFVPGWTWDLLHDAVRELPVKVIADHLGGLRGTSKLPSELQSTPMSQPGFRSLLSLARRSIVYVKISGLYRMSDHSASTFDDLQPIVQAMAREIPDQVIWGSDWPHTGDGHNRVKRSIESKEPFRMIDNHAILQRLHDWMGDEAYWKMMVDNPGRLYID
ncbi:amidohydrolase 2 [Aspergillus piperis CBS 112811]|uniref:Amidohydrolase 2 n=1 Tax=Aspergillus piperis CBS 112811 TaxID=1448313 RepID=A0A8G1R9G2_9EURO|nr:amidohydrolase 2 [Aspergillus piperis CBS 112811]RAH60659.1 amidohydrolase 2 [Aspergillus piperis CBS 112811]